MTPQERNLARERLAEPFVPVGGPIEQHSIHALNHIAYSLGEIEKHLEKIANNSETSLDRLKEIAVTIAKGRSPKDRR